jgi:large repetitive protein
LGLRSSAEEHNKKNVSCRSAFVAEANRLRRAALTWSGAAALLLAPSLVWAADPQIGSFTDTDPVPAGAVYQYDVRVDNNAIDAATNVRLRVTVPSGATFVSASPAGANCTPVSAAIIECNLGTVGPSGGDVRDVTMLWRALGPGPTTIASSATLTSDNDTNPGNNTQTQTTTVINGANMALTKTDSPDPVVGGANVTYTLTASNPSGPNDAGNIVITDTLPPAVAFVSAAGPGWTCGNSAGTVTCTRPGPHPIGVAIPPVQIVGTVNASGGTVTNSATLAPAAAGGIADPDTSNNTATASTTVLPGADVRIQEKAVTSPQPVTAGTNVTFVIRPRNGGPAAATTVQVSDPLPAGWTFVSANGPNWTCGNTGNTVNCTRATMPVGATDDITVVATAPPNAQVLPQGQNFTNTANITSATTDPNATNNSGSVSVLVRRNGADLRLEKLKTPNPVAVGAQLTSDIFVANDGPLVATGPIRVNERLTNETFVSAGPAPWSCSVSGQDVVCNHPNTGGLAVNGVLPTLRIITTALSAGGANTTVSNFACTGSSVPPGSSGVALPPNEGDPNTTNDCKNISGTATVVQPDLTITKTTSTPNGNKVLETNETAVTYTVVVRNVSVAQQFATGVRVQDTVPGFITGPGGSTFGTITTQVTQAGATGALPAFACSNVDAAVTCLQTSGNFAQGDQLTITIPVNRPLQDGSFTNTAVVDNRNEGDPVLTNNSAQDTITIDPVADVQMTGKQVTPAALRAGEIATYVLSFRNAGPSTAAGVVVADTINFPSGDSGFTVIEVLPSVGTCSISAGAQLTPAANSFNCSIGTLANGQTESITLRVRPNFQAGTGVRTIPNTANITSTTADSDTDNNTQSTSLTVNPALLDLITNKTDRVGNVNYDPVPYGSPVANVAEMYYQVTVTNSGPSFGTNVRVNENMAPPANRSVRFVCDTVSFGRAGGLPTNPRPACNSPSLCTVVNVTSGSGTPIPQFSCQVPAGNATTGAGVGELASGQSKNIFLLFEALDQPSANGDIFSNTATAVANETDSQPGNDTEGEQTTTRQRVDLRTTKTASVASPALRQPFSWTVVVENRGPGNSLQTNITDTLPAGAEVTGPITWTRTAVPATGSCPAPVGNTITCQTGQLDANGTVTITIPARYTSVPSGGTATNTATVDTDPAVIGGIDIPGGNNTGTVNQTPQAASLAGTVFEDRDRAGANGGTPQAAAAEPRIGGVTVQLTGTDDFGNTVSLSTTTAADGSYSFGNLSPSTVGLGGGYTITQVQPGGFVNGPVNPPTGGAAAPSLGGTYASGGAGNSSYAAVPVTASAAGVNYNFPEVRRPSLSGFVYIDVDANNTRNAGTDLPISGATVRLLNASTGAVLATATTDGTGAYGFSNLDPLIPYTVEEPLPSTPTGLANSSTAVNPGLINGVACTIGCVAQPNTPAANTDRIAQIDLSTGTDGTVFNFGEIQTSFVSGLVWVDSNRDGTLQGGETQRLGSVTLRLVQGADCTSGTTLQTTTTASDGTYRFDNVRAFQNYLVCETQPAGYGTGTGNGAPGNVASVSNLPATGSPNNNFGETTASLAGSVYQDTGNGVPAQFDNGVRDTGEPGIANVPVTLSGTDVLGNPVSITVNTDTNGNYVFEGLIAAGPGGYTVTEGPIPPASGSFLDGRDTVGNAGGGSITNDVFTAVPLPAGQQGSGYLFGELPNTTISGTVYLDRNGDNTINPTPTDGRLPGVTIRLVQGASCAAGTVQQTTTSDAQGNYSFSNVAAGGSYLVCESQPPGYADAATNPGTNGTSPGANVISISNLPATGSAGNNFGERGASLAGSVFVDFSPATPANTDNGTRDAGETGIAGVPVTLTGTDINGNLVNLSTTTDSSGNYVFNDLVASGPGGYTVTEGAIPTSAGNFNDGQDRAGSAGGAAGNDATTAVNLAAGVQASGYTFAELPIAPISGTVYIDRDRDNQIDPAPTDGRIPGVTLNLVLGPNCSGTVVSTTSTDASGNYTFSGASAGLTYTICQVQPVGYADGTVNPGSGGSSGVPNGITITNLPAGGSPNNHFGERVGSLAGSVYLDANNDGTRQGADAGIAGVTVTLTGTDAAGNPVNRTTTTDASGNYSFGDLLAAGPGGYTVTEQTAQPVVGGTTTLNGRTTAGNTGGTATAVGNTPSAITGITLAAGADSSANNFGEILPVAVSGVAFIDLDNDGIQDAPGDTGLSGVQIVITGTDDTGTPVTRTVTTGPDGSYSVSDLRPGTYTINQPTQPAGTSNGLTVPGSAGGTATPPGTTPSAISNVVLTTPGTVSAGNNFAEIPNNSIIEGRVWLDTNNSGSIDGTETGIAGVTIELTGTDAAGRPVSRTTTTDASGNYRFDNLSPGNYTVREPAQPAGTINGATLPGTLGGTATGLGTTPSAISAITLGVGQTSSSNNFGEVPASRIAGNVYADNNNNGSIDSGESGLPGVTVTLTGTDDQGNPVTRTTTTAADGSYSFDDLRPGSYTVTEPTQPPGTVNGITTPGSLGGTATPPATTPSAISAITLPPGGSSTGNNFGELANSPDLRVSKALVEPRFTVGFPGSYRITVRNVGEIASSGVYTVSDRLPGGMTLAATPGGNGWTCAGAAGAATFSCTSSSAIGAGATSADAITATVSVNATAAANSPLNNVVLVDGGGEIDARRPSAAERDAFNNNPATLQVCTDPATHNVCRTPTPVQLAAAVSGTVWYDLGSNPRLLDGGDRRLQGWQVEIVDLTTGNVVGRATTAADGSYRVPNLLPGVPLAVRFRDPASGVVFGYPVNGNTAPGSSGANCVANPPIGTPSSCVGTGASPFLTVTLAAGQELPQQSLPVDPSGVVYDSGLRQPVPGSIVTLSPVGACAGWNPATGLVGAGLGGYSINGGNVSMTVGSDGFYQFLFAPAAPPSCTWRLAVTPPAGYTFQSTAIPPEQNTLTPPGGPTTVFPVQPQAGAPLGAVPAATTYYLTFTSGSAGANIIHNHIPLDPQLPTGISLTKTGDKAAAEVGDSIRYTITVTVTAGARPRQTTVIDRLPAGFTYIRGTAMVGDTPIADPQGGLGPRLAFDLGPMGATNQLVLRYRVRVGVGAMQGDGVNRAQGRACGAPGSCVDSSLNPFPGGVSTNEASFRVRVSGGVFTTDACVLGKIFVDCNNNHVQDAEELGIPGVRLVMQDGTTLISDSEGKYSICGVAPKSSVLKVDPITLPRGSRLTTSSNRNLGDAGSLWLDLKNGELHRADFIEGSCSNTVLEQVKARRAQGEVRAPESEKKGGPALRFDSKAHGKSTTSSPQQGTDGANQQVPKPRKPTPVPKGAARDETNVPATELPMNRPPPSGRDSGTAPDAPASAGGAR